MKDANTYYGGKTKAKGMNRSQLWITKGEKLLLLVMDDTELKIVRVLRGSAAHYFSLENQQDIGPMWSDKSVQEDAGRIMRTLLMKAVLNDAYGSDTANRFGRILAKIIQNETPVQQWVCTPAKLFSYVLECEQHAQRVNNLIDLDLSIQPQRTSLPQQTIVLCDSALAAIELQKSNGPGLKAVVPGI